MTLQQFTELRETLDKLGIYYEDGNYYDSASNDESICGHWLEIKMTLFETFEVSKENVEDNDTSP